MALVCSNPVYLADCFIVSDRCHLCKSILSSRLCSCALWS